MRTPPSCAAGKAKLPVSGLPGGEVPSDRGPSVTRSEVHRPIEVTTSRGIRTDGLRRSRHAVRAETEPQHLATAAAMKFRRITDLSGRPRHAGCRRMTPRG